MSAKIMKFGLVLSMALAAVLAFCSATRAETWLYNGDRSGAYFENSGNGVWHEVVEDGTVFNFQEKKRTNDYIELLDSSRSIWIRLYSGSVQIRYPGSNGYQFFHQGMYQP